MTQPRVVIESPLRGVDPAFDSGGRSRDYMSNQLYAIECFKDAIRHGEAPVVMHLLYPSVLSDEVPKERELGLELSHRWIEVCDYVVAYIDKGISPGMERALEAAKTYGKEVQYRSLKAVPGRIEIGGEFVTGRLGDGGEQDDGRADRVPAPGSV